MSLIKLDKKLIKPYRVDRTHPLSKGLDGWWMLDEMAGLTVHDLSKTKKDGTLTNMDPPVNWTGSGKGGTLGFDGTNDFVEMSQGGYSHLTNDLTLSVWINPLNETLDFKAVLAPDFWLGIYTYGTYVAFYYYDTEDRIVYSNASVIAANTWTHILATKSSTAGVKHYINGVLDLTSAGDTADGVLYGGSYPALAANRWDSSSAYYYYGYAKDARIYSRVLSDAEVLELYRNPYGNLVPVLPFQIVSAAVDVVVNAGVVNLTLTAYGANVNAEVNVATSVDALTLTENNATVNAEVSISAGVATLSIVAYQVSINAETSVDASSASLTLTSNQANVNYGIVVSAGLSNLTLTEYQSNVNAKVNINASVDGLTLSVHSASVGVGVIDVTVSANVVNLVLTEKSANVSYDLLVPDEMDPPPLKDSMTGDHDKVVKSSAWSQWFSKLVKKQALSPANDSTKFLRGDDTWDFPQLKYYASSAEPILANNNTSAIWKDTDDSNKIYLVFRRGVADQVKVELT